MNQPLTLLDPTAENEPVERARLPRLATLRGQTIGLLDISKPRGDVFLDTLQSCLEAQDATIIRYTKPTYARPAPVELQQQIANQCDGVIEALAD